MWDTKERATAVVFYSLAVVAGPNLGVSNSIMALDPFTNQTDVKF